MATKEHVLVEYRGGEEWGYPVPWMDGDGHEARKAFDSMVTMYPASRVMYFYADEDGGSRLVEKPTQAWSDPVEGQPREIVPAEFDSTAERIEIHRPLFG